MRKKFPSSIERLFVVLFFLSGQFTLSRIPGFDTELPAKYFFLFISPLVFLVTNSVQPTKESLVKIPFNLSRFLVLTFLYFIVLSSSVFYSINEKMSLIGVVDIVFMTLLIVEFVFIVVKSHPVDFITSFSYLWLVIGLVYTLPVFLDVFQGSVRGQSIGGPNVATRIMFFSACSSIHLWKNTNKRKYLIFLLFIFAGIFLVGSRGGAVGAISVLLFLLIVKKNKKRRRTLGLKKILFFIFIFFLIYLMFEPVMEIIRSRFIETTFRDDGTIYLSGRDHLYSVVISYIKMNPILGYGINTFYSITGYMYPHNMLLELIYSIGILGGVFFVIFLFYSIIIIFRAKKTSFFWLSGLPLYLIIVQMISGGLYDFRYYYMWMITLIFAFSRDNKL